MGVSYYACSCCGESRYEEFVGSCTCCNTRICTRCVANDDIGSDYAYDYGVIYDGSAEQKHDYGIEDDWEEKGWVTLGEIIDDTAIAPKYCPYCQGDEINEVKFLEFLMRKLGKSREELEEEYKKAK